MVLGRAVTVPGRYVPVQYAFCGVKFVRNLMDMPNFQSHLRKKRCCAFLTNASMWKVQDRSSVIITPRILMLSTLSTSVPLMLAGSEFFSFLSEVDDQFFSFADVESLFSLHHITKPSISLLYFDSSLLDICPTTGVISKLVSRDMGQMLANGTRLMYEIWSAWT
eukprot:g27621.t1